MFTYSQNDVKFNNKIKNDCTIISLLFQVTSLLLEGERRKLSVLQKELQEALEEGGSFKAKEHQKQELLIAIAYVK